MLQLILGRAGSGKTGELYRRIGAAADRGDRAILLVPEQFSFENERELYLRLGPERSARVEVLGFKRLCNNIFRFYGGLAGRSLDDTGRRILMGVALREMGSGLTVYGPQADKPGFIEDLIGEVRELKSAGVTPEALSAASIADPSLADKVGDIAAIYAAYQALIDQNYLDGEDDILRALELVSPREFFGGVSVFIDSFTAFMEAEYRLLAAILAGADEVTAAFTCDGLLDDEGGLGVFSASKETAARLIRLAEDAAVPVAEPLVMGEPLRFQAEGLRRIERGLFRERPAGEPAGEGVVLVEAGDVYEECAAVAASICADVRKRGMRYNQIAVICRDLTPYRIALTRSFERHGIPFFADLPEGAGSTPAVVAAETALDCAAEGFTAGHLLRFAKCAAVGLAPEDTAEFENYCYIWNAGPKDWSAPFRNHPDGLGATLDDRARERLNRANAVREAVLPPLERFRQAVREADGPGFAAAVYDLLMAVDAPDHIRALCAQAGSEEEAARALEREDRAWEALMGLLDTLVAVIGPRRLSLPVLRSLFLSGAAGISLGEIPQTLDQVIVGTADRIRPTGIRSAYVIGASAGVFPAACGAAGLFGEGERRALIAAGIPLSQTAQTQAVREKFYAYFAVTVPSERLWISFPAQGLDGGAASPSSILTESAALTGLSLIPARALDLPRVVNRTTALEQLAAAPDGEEGAALRAALDGGLDLPRHVQAAATHRAAIADRGTARQLFGGDMTLSATRLELFYSCPYSYFCRYGLRLRIRRRAEFSPLEFGTLVHAVLEALMRAHTPQELQDMEDALLRREIRRLADELLPTRVADPAALPRRFTYLYGRMAEQIFRLVRILAAELCQSEFKPLAYEYPISEQEGTRPVVLRTADGDRVRVEGKVDRVDLYEGSDRDYIRVIDYKTGKKEFVLSEAVQGLNMQMLLYLFTLGENGIGPLRHPGEAGVLYLPGTGGFTRGDRTTPDKDILDDQRSQYRMSGMVLDEPEVVEAMELGVSGVFIPVTRNKDGSFTKRSSLASAHQLELVRRQLERNIVEMAELLHQGQIPAVPARRGAALPCAYCEYRTVCGREDPWPDRPIVKLSNAEIFSELEGGQLAWRI